MKKKVVYSIVAIAFLVICYMIGQFVVRPNRKDAETMDTTEEQSYFYDYGQKSEELELGGYEEKDDMPGGKTVGLIEDDTYGKWYLMTPGTSITAGIILDDKDRKLSFKYCIHKDVAALSDGMDLTVQVIQEDTGDVLYKESVDVTKEEKSFELDLSDWKNSNVFIRLEAGNHTDDETGDWLVIDDAHID